MAWDDSSNAGFTSTSPGFRSTRLAVRNVAAGIAMLTLCSPCTARCWHFDGEPALSVGAIQRIEGSDHVLAYQRRHDASRLQIILNLTGTERRIPDRIEPGELLLSTLGSLPAEGWLRPDEGLVLRLADA